jgi:hypothetical protein
MSDPACGAPKVVGDPSADTRFAYSEERYDVPQLGAPNLKGSIYFPAHMEHFLPGSAAYVGGPHAAFAHIGAAPVVILAHGVHPTSSSPEGDTSYLGYPALQAALAWAGIVAVSVHLDFTKSPTDQAKAIVEHVRYLAGRNWRVVDQFFGKLDLTHLGLFGHSRGGSAIMEVPGLLPSGTHARALLALASDGWHAAPPAGIPLMTILPGAEWGGAYSTLGHPTAPGFPDVSGAKLYDHDAPAPFKAQLYVRHADHLLWNRQWKPGDAVVPGEVVAREVHEMILRCYGAAFFRAFLQDLPSSDGERAAFLKRDTGRIAYLNGFRLPKLVDPASPSSGQYATYEVDPDDLVASWQSGFALTVEDYQQGNGPRTNSLGAETTFHHVGWAQKKDFAYAGDTTLFVATVKPGAPGHIRTALPRSARDLTHRTAVTIRAAETLAFDQAKKGVGFELGLEGADGHVAWVSAGRVGGLPRPFVRNDGNERYVFKTLRFSLACFEGLHRGDVRAILLRPMADAGREIAFDTLQIE